LWGAGGLCRSQAGADSGPQRSGRHGPELGARLARASPLSARVSAAPAMRGGMLCAAVVLSVAGAACALGAPGAPAASCGAQIPAQARPLRLRGGGESLADLPSPDTKRLLELGKATG